MWKTNTEEKHNKYYNIAYVLCYISCRPTLYNFLLFTVNEVYQYNETTIMKSDIGWEHVRRMIGISWFWGNFEGTRIIEWYRWMFPRMGEEGYVKAKAKAKAQVLSIAPLNMRSTCQRRFTIVEVVTDQHWLFYSSQLVRRKLSGAHSPRNGLWTRRCCQQAYYAPINL